MHPPKKEKRQRILYAALSGFAAGTIQAVVAGCINVWLYPGLSIDISWPAIFQAWLLWAGLGGILASVAAVSSEGWSTIILSALLMAVAALVVNFVHGIDSLFLNMLVLLGLAIPVYRPPDPPGLDLFLAGAAFHGGASAQRPGAFEDPARQRDRDRSPGFVSRSVFQI
jgi:hypothetical protein